MNVPVFTMQIDSMKHTLKAMVSEHAARLDTHMKAAIDGYCSEENLNQVINAEVRQNLDVVMKEEIRNYFGYGSIGRKVVKEAIHKHLDEIYGE